MTNKIVLPNVIIEQNSVKVNCECEIPNWRFVETNNTIYFSEDLLQDHKYIVEYKTIYSGISRTYGLNIPKYHPENPDDKNSGDYDNYNVSDTNKISFEGTKTIGVMIGSNGEAAINQSLDVEIYGNIDSATTISARISDQSSSLDGQTSEIGELDKIYISVENPKWSATAGDLEIRSNELGILKEFYTPKGLFTRLKNDEIGRENNAFAGISGTKSGYNKFTGVTGIQNGMFNLRPNENSAFIQIISGSVSVSIDGKTLEESENYIVDYDFAAIKFTAKTPITDGQIIEVKYKYRNYDYNTFSTGTRHKFSVLDSSLSFDFSVYYDKDIWESSQRDFTQDEISQIMNSGQNAPQFLSGSKIHKNDALKAQASKRIYFLDSMSNVYYWESNPEAVYLEKDLYSVNFRASDSGDYIPYYPDYRAQFTNYANEYLDSVENAASLVLEPIYLFVGKGEGYFTAYGEVILPKRSVRGEISVTYAPSEQLRINIVAAGENFDENTLSNKKDRYENLTAMKADMFISSNPQNNFLVKDKFEMSSADDIFINDVLDRYEMDNKWGISQDLVNYRLWENVFYAGFQKSILLKGGYGQSAVNSSQNPYSKRISGGFEAGNELPFYFDYLFAQRIIENNNGSGRRQNANISFDFSKLYLNFGFEESWFKNESNYSGDFISQISAENDDKTLSGFLQYKRNDSGETDRHFSAKENFWHVLISSSANGEINKNHKIKADGSAIFREKSFEMLISLYDNIYSDDYSKGIDTKWELSYETQSEQRWEYIKVPAGTGTHIKDTISGNFVEYPFGDYAAREIFVYEPGANYPSRSFISGDFGISWYNQLKNVRLSGNFIAESKMPKNSGKWYEFLPVTANISKKLQESVSYSFISYNQYISVFPQNSPQVMSNVRFGVNKTVENKNIRLTFEEESDFLYKFYKFHLGFSNKGFLERRENYNNYDFFVRDLNFKPIETFVFRDFLHIFTEQTLGLTVKDSISGNYFAIRPGIKFLPKNAGSADISYSYSFVDFDGDLLYNMADGFAKRNNHRIQSVIGIKANEKLRFNGFVRGDKNENTGGKWRISASLNAEITIN